MNLRTLYNFPVPIRFGAGVVDELGLHLVQKGLRNPLLVTDPIVAGLPFFEKIIENLKSEGLNIEVFTDLHKNPVESDVLKGGAVYEKTNRDAIIGIGGGVPMDVARAIALGVNHDRPLFDYDDLIGGNQYVTEKIPYFVTVPTTAGSGSEVGRSAIIAEDDTKKKRILFSPKLQAKQIFADPVLSVDLPAFVTAATGMDALTHNMEAYLAKGFHPMCDGIALEGIRLITEALPVAVKNPKDIEARGKMMIASLMGAVAFQKGLGVVHSLAHPMSSLLDTHHGLANAVNLPYGLQFNYRGFEDRFDRMGEVMGLGPHRGEDIPDFIFKFNKKLGIPIQLRDVGVKQQDIEKLADLAIQDFCHPSNPKSVSREDFFNLYHKAY